MNTNKWFDILQVTLLITLAWQLPALAAGDDLYIPQDGKTLQSFLPPGYEIGIEAHADFNKDGRDDIAALLWASPESTQIRHLIVLLGQPSGIYRLSVRTDYFTITDVDSCGAGNWYCVPRIRTKGSELVIDMPWGSAAGYVIYENTFRLIGPTWYQVRQADYNRSPELTCPGSAAHKDERCVEQGITKDLQNGVTTNYCEFADDDGKETRRFKVQSTFAKAPLKRLIETKWENIE